jgi:hypothetical protein
MALTSVPIFRLPSHHFATTNLGPAFTTAITIDAVGERAAAIFHAPATGSIEKIAYRVATHTTTGNADIRLETVDLSTGNPSGTLWAANTNATQSINASNTWFTTTLTSAASVNAGDLLAVVIESPAASTLNTQITTIANSTMGQKVFPHYASFAAAAWTKTAGSLVCTVEYSGGVYYPISGVYPYTAIAGTTYASNSTPDERGNTFILPYRCRACGAYVQADIDAAADVVLYDTDGTTALATVSIDTDVRSNVGPGLFWVQFPSAVTLEANSTYRLALKPTTTTGIGVYHLTVASAAIFTGAITPGGTIQLTTRTDAGAWSETAEAQMAIGLEIDQIDIGAPIGPGGLRGGFQ